MWIVLFGYAVLVLLRMPQIVIKGRFWAEEGSEFFVAAWSLDPMTALLRPFGGYLNLVATAATLVARWGPPLELAPYVTITVALLFHLCPPLLVLLARDRWLADWRVRLVAVALLLTVSGGEEVWLQTLHCQFELMLSAALLLAFAVPRGGVAVFGLGLLVLAPLAGPGVTPLLPLFVVRAAMERSGSRALQAAALAAGSALQLGLFFTVASGRVYAADPATLLTVVTIKHLLVPFLGAGRTHFIAERWRATLLAGGVPWVAVTAPLVATGALVWAIVVARAWVALWLVGIAALLAGSAYVGALEGASSLLHEFAGERYAYVPQSLVGLAVLALGTMVRGTLRLVTAVLCLWLLVVGSRQFYRSWSLMADGPAWREQVALWRADPSYVLKIWPKPEWTMRLAMPPGSLQHGEK